MAQKFENYKQDEFRQSIEKQIGRLEKELTVNIDRINSINHLLGDAQKAYANNEKNEDIDFLSKMGVKKTEIDNNLVFVLTPFNPDYYDQYAAIKEVVEELEFTCRRGDEDNLPSEILPFIVQNIKKARLIIANLSGRNPNVLYELGIAHSLGKPVIMVTESLSEPKEDLPFDISKTRILTFKTTDGLKNKLRNWIIHTLTNIPTND
jgi:hypothetical protein